VENINFKMKVLYIIDSLRSGGKERRLVSLIDSFVDFENMEIELIILSDIIHYQEILSLNIKIHTLKRDIRKDVKILSKFKEIINSFRPDIVHCWDNIGSAHFGPICKFRKVPFINSMITAAPYTNKMSKRYLSHAISYPFSDVILSNSQAGLDNLFVPKRKQAVIYNGFNFSRLEELKKKEIVFEQFKISQNRPVVGMVASFIDKKDHVTFIEAASHLKDIFSFVLVGEGYLENEMKSLAKKMNVSHIHFLGKQQDVESVVNIFDIGILLSNPSKHGEGISNAIMEYMVLEKPVIASIGGGTAELVENNETGFLIAPKNTAELVQKISYLNNELSIAKEMGKKGRKRIEEFFSIDKMVNDTYKLYLKNIKIES